MEKLRELFYRFLHDETGAICVGCGLNVNVDGILEVDLADDAAADHHSGLDCNNTTGLSLAVQHSDSTCIGLTGNGTNASKLQANINLADSASALACDATGLRVVASPDDCNSVEVRSNGLYVPCSDGVAGTILQTSPQGSGLPQLLDTDGADYDYLNDNAFNSIAICNLTCCAINGYLSVSVGDAYLDLPPGAIVKAKLQINVDNAGFVDMVPTPIQILAVDSGNVQNGFMYVYQNATYFVNCAPAGSAGDCHFFQFRLRFSVQEAAGATGHIRTDSTGPKFVTRWVLTHTACCDHHD